MDISRRLFLAMMFLVLSGQQALAADPAGGIARLTGSAQLLRNGARIPLTEGMNIFVHDHVLTAVGARMEVVFADGTKVVLSEATDMAVDAWQFSSRKKGGKLLLRLTSGSVLVTGGHLAAGADPHLHLRTPVATVGVRGTRVWAGPVDNRFGILLLEGGVFVENVWGRVDISEPGTGIMVDVPDEASRKQYWELVDGWTGPGAPPVPGSPLGQPEAWSPDMIADVLGTVRFKP